MATAMDQDEDDFLYGDNSNLNPPSAPPASSASVPGLTSTPAPEQPNDNDELEEGEEEEEEIEVTDESDVEIVTERKDGSRPEPPPQPSRYNQVRMAPTRISSNDNRNTPIKPESSTSPAPQASATPVHPPTATSKLDINAVPSYSGTPLNKIPMESEVLPADKPWRKPGADVTDYFNYGFDEFTWTAYCQKQEGTRDEFNPQKMMEQMMMLSGMSMQMGMGGMDPSMMGDMGAMMGQFGMVGSQQGAAGAGAGPPTGPSAATAAAGPQGMDMMGDPSMYMGGAGGYDDRSGGNFGMAGRGAIPQGPAAGHMGGYGGYGQGGFGPRGGRGGRRW